METKRHEKLEGYLEASPRLDRLYQATRERFEAQRMIAHNWDHIYRDIINAIWIGEAEDADMNIVLPATILHDIGFLYDPDFRRHHLVGHDHCGEFLGEWPAPEVRAIAGCIRAHKGGTPGFDFRPTTLEEQVVCDADNVDKTGYVGVFQGIKAFVEFTENGLEAYRRLHQMAEYFARTPEVDFFTATARKIAAERGGDLRATFCRRALEELTAYRY